jgi:hypothetical protein
MVILQKINKQQRKTGISPDGDSKGGTEMDQNQPSKLKCHATDLVINTNRDGEIIDSSVGNSHPVKEPEVVEPLSEETHLLTKIQSDLAQRNEDSIKVGDLLHFISQLCRENVKGRPDKPSRQLGIPNSSIHDELSSLTDHLFLEYCSRVRYQVREWLLKSSWERRGVLSPKNNFHLATHDPEDIIYCINMQMSVARDHLPPFLCIDVLIVILDEVEQMQQRIRKYLNSSDENTLLIESVCTIVNDCASLYEQFDDLNLTRDLLGGAILPSYKLKKKKDQITVEYINLAVYATDALAQTIIMDLKPILAKFHSSAWGFTDQMDTILSTFRDYFQDLSLWIPSFFYSKCIRHCLEHTLELYVESFFANKTYLDVKTKAALLERDRLNLLDFFGSEYSQEMKQAGFAGVHDVEERFEILQVMQSIIHAGSPSDVPREINVILTEFGNHDGKAAILYLRAISISDQPLKTKQEVILWSSAIDDACKTNPASVFRARTPCEISPIHADTIAPKIKAPFHQTLRHEHEKEEVKRKQLKQQPRGIQYKIEKVKAAAKLNVQLISKTIKFFPSSHKKKHFASC